MKSGIDGDKLDKECMNHARNPTKDGEDDVEDKVKNEREGSLEEKD